MVMTHGVTCNTAHQSHQKRSQLTVLHRRAGKERRLTEGRLACYKTYQLMAPKKKARSLRLKTERSRLAQQLPDVERLLRGSLVERYKKCGKLGCHCAQGKGHGPALYLSITLGPGKTRSYYVPAHLAKCVARYLGNYQRLREIAERIIRINRKLLEEGFLGEEDRSE